MKNSAGFTLIEILVVMAIFAIIGTILVTVFANTLRGSNKSQILAVIKQNGQAVLDTMDKTIREADNVICPNDAINPGDTLVVVKNGCYTRYRFIAPSPNPNPVRNGQIQQDNPQPDPNTPCIQNSPRPSPTGIVSFTNTICTDPMEPNPNVLTDTNQQTGVSVNRGALFTRNKQPGSKDSLTIFFTLSPGVSTPSIMSSQIDPVSFETTVGLR